MPLLRLRPGDFDILRVDRLLVARSVPRERLTTCTSAFAIAAGGALLCLTLTTLRVGAQVPGESAFDEAVRRGDSAWKAESYPVARAAYAQALAIDSVRSARALFRLSTIEAWDNDLTMAIAGFRRYVALEPDDEDGRVGLARTLAWAARYSESIALYDSVLARDSGDRDAALGRAQVLASASAPDASIAAYEHWLKSHASDPDARLGLARSLSLAGRLESAEAEYRGLLKGDHRLDAQKGLARVAALRGDLRASESQWRAVLAQTADDPEALTGLAQTLMWAGNPRLARALLRRALTMQASYGEARALLVQVDAALAPAVRPVLDHLTDSDGNNVTTATLEASTAGAWNGRVRAVFRQRQASFEGASTTVTSATGGAGWTSDDGGVALSATGGAAMLGGGCATSVSGCSGDRMLAPIATGSLALRLGGSGSLDVSVARTPFDDTRTLMVNRLSIEDATAALRWTLPAAVTLSGAFGRGRVIGGVQNGRRSYRASVRRSWSPHFSLAAGVRGYGYDTTTTDGYFAPHEYLLIDGSSVFALGRDLGWFVSGEAAVGDQWIDLRGVSQRAVGRLRLSPGWRWRPGMEMALDVDASNMAAVGQRGRGNYQSLAVGISAMWVF